MKTKLFFEIAIHIFWRTPLVLTLADMIRNRLQVYASPIAHTIYPTGFRIPISQICVHILTECITRPRVDPNPTISDLVGGVRKTSISFYDRKKSMYWVPQKSASLSQNTFILDTQ